MVPPRGLRQLPCPEHWYHSTKGPVQSTFARICASVTKQNLQVRPARQAAMAASAAGGGTGLAWVKVGFCSSGGRLVPGVGGSVAACFLYIASRLRLQHVVLPAACRRLHKPAADTQVVEKHRTQSNRPPKIWQACNPCTGIATVKFHVGYFIVPVRAFSASMPP